MTTVPNAPDAYDRRDQQETRSTIESALEDLERPIATYVCPAVTATSTGAPVRTITSTATLTDIRDIVITLLNDLKTAGRIG